MRELANCAHLFEADIAYLLHTGCGITSAHTAVVSTEHSALLTQGYIQDQNYGVLNPPPIRDCFRTLYTKTNAELAATAFRTPTAAATAAVAALPATAPTTLPDNHKLAPDRIMLLDLKLRNVVLGLVTSRGRKRHYQSITQSGCELLKHMYHEAKPTTRDYMQSPHILKLKAQLASIRRLTMSHISQIEFDEIRDAIEEINDQLEDDDKMTNNHECTQLDRTLCHVRVFLCMLVTPGHKHGGVF